MNDINADAGEGLTPVCFEWWVRVYYEDTDASGVVYHAAYLAYLERARTEWLRALGANQQDLRLQAKVAFTVSRLSIDYLRPAHLDDELMVTVAVNKIGRASFVLGQALMRNTETLCKAQVRIGCVDADSFRPRAMPFVLT